MNPAQLLWNLSHDLASGTALVQLRGQRLSPARVELFRGWVHAVDLFPLKLLIGTPPARGEDALTLLLKRSDADWRFDAKLAGTTVRSGGPFHPAAVVRNLLGGAIGEAWRARSSGARLQILKPPHQSCIGLDERGLVAYLAQPHSLAEVDAVALCGPTRAANLLAFLELVGALTVERTVGRDEAYRLLELPDGADPEAIKSAYRRLARALHPDTHPSATPDELRELGQRFAAISAAYRRLVPIT